MEIYGAAVADKLDNNRGILRRRYYRQHCTPEMGSYTKDLAAICSDLASVFILDNSPGAYRAYPSEFKKSETCIVKYFYKMRLVMLKVKICSLRGFL